jgi:hypothetical protein
MSLGCISSSRCRKLQGDVICVLSQRAAGVGNQDVARLAVCIQFYFCLNVRNVLVFFSSYRNAIRIQYAVFPLSPQMKYNTFELSQYRDRCPNCPDSHSLSVTCTSNHGEIMDDIAAIPPFLIHGHRFKENNRCDCFLIWSISPAMNKAMCWCTQHACVIHLWFQNMSVAIARCVRRTCVARKHSTVLTQMARLYCCAWKFRC